MKLQRLFEMRPAELAFRSRQQLATRLDRLVSPLGNSSPICRYEKQAGDTLFQRIALQMEKGDPSAAAEQLKQRFEQIAPSRFFVGASEHGLAARIASQCAEARQRTIESANAVCRDEFDILGYGMLSFGSPVHWQFDAVSGRRIAPAHGSRIQYLANDQVGDSKVVWELNRHQWLLDLGQAYRYTRDASYAETFAWLLRHWMKLNPPGFGMNWSSSLEAALRMISWCWALFLFRDAAALTPELFQQMLGWIQAHARYVERNLSHYFSPNTHLIGEALGLFYAGNLLPELEGATRWRMLGHQILVAQMDRQVLPDGVYFEQSTRYQYYTVEMYLHFIIMADRNQLEVPEKVRTRLEQMVEFLLHVRRPDGTVPQIGDTDGGWLLPLVRRAPGDYRGLFSTAAVLFNNPQFAWAASNGAITATETQWLLGSSALNSCFRPDMNSGPDQRPSSPPLVKLRSFPEGGYVVMRNGWHTRAHQLIFDAGPLGCGISGGHGHADLLSVQCSVFGENFLVDAGTFCYTADATWRNFFRSSEAHSTVRVDDHGQADPKGPFSWHSRPSARLLNCAPKPGYSLADAEHDAWGSLEDPVIHRRRVLFVDSRYWLIIDDLSGHAAHSIDLRYQFAPIPVEVEQHGWVRAHGSSSALLIKTFSSVPLSTSIARGQLRPPAGWYSPNYGQMIAAPAVTFNALATLPLRVVTLLYPLANPQADPPAVTMLAGACTDGETVAAMKLEIGEQDNCFIKDHEVFIQNGK